MTTKTVAELESEIEFYKKALEKTHDQKNDLELKLASLSKGDGSYLETLAITSVQVYPLNQPAGKMKALARVVIADQLQLTGLRVIDGANGLFVSYPNDPSYKSEDYRSLFYPITENLRDDIEKAVLAKYNELMHA